MPTYIIRPNNKIISQSLSLIDRKFDVESRKKQAQEVAQIYKEDTTYQALTQWSQEIEQQKDSHLLKSPKDIGITGSAIVQMSEEQAQETRRQYPQFSILKDQPIDLIQPHKITASYKTENELKTEDLWHLDAIGLNGQQSLTGEGVTIAVLDTGIDSSHPALRGKISKAFEFDISRKQVKQLSNSLDTDGHGTHVAGLICGDRIGVAPRATLINTIMIPKGKGSLSNFVLAFDWAANNPEISIVNVSAGLRGFFPDLEDIVNDMLSVGIFPVCAVGNEGRDQSRSPGNYRSVLSVGASNSRNKIANFSSGGELFSDDNHRYVIPHLVAPGEEVYSAVVQGGYESWSGTSMATPIVSGIAALILEKNPYINLNDLREELIDSCKDLGFSKDRQGFGLIQANNL